MGLFADDNRSLGALLSGGANPSMPWQAVPQAITQPEVVQPQTNTPGFWDNLANNQRFRGNIASALGQFGSALSQPGSAGDLMGKLGSSLGASGIAQMRQQDQDMKNKSSLDYLGKMLSGASYKDIYDAVQNPDHPLQGFSVKQGGDVNLSLRSSAVPGPKPASAPVAGKTSGGTQVAPTTSTAQPNVQQISPAADRGASLQGSSGLPAPVSTPAASYDTVNPSDSDSSAVGPQSRSQYGPYLAGMPGSVRSPFGLGSLAGSDANLPFAGSEPNSDIVGDPISGWGRASEALTHGQYDWGVPYEVMSHMQQAEEARDKALREDVIRAQGEDTKAKLSQLFHAQQGKHQTTEEQLRAQQLAQQMAMHRDSLGVQLAMHGDTLSERRREFEETNKLNREKADAVAEYRNALASKNDALIEAKKQSLDLAQQKLELNQALAEQRLQQAADKQKWLSPEDAARHEADIQKVTKYDTEENPYIKVNVFNRNARSPYIYAPYDKNGVPLPDGSDKVKEFKKISLPFYTNSKGEKIRATKDEIIELADRNNWSLQQAISDIAFRESNKGRTK